MNDTADLPAAALARVMSFARFVLRIHDSLNKNLGSSLVIGNGEVTWEHWMHRATLVRRPGEVLLRLSTDGDVLETLVFRRTRENIRCLTDLLAMYFAIPDRYKSVETPTRHRDIYLRESSDEDLSGLEHSLDILGSLARPRTIL